MLWLILGLILFLGVHSARMLVPDFREKFIAKRGEMTLERALCAGSADWSYVDHLGLWPGAHGPR